MNRLRNGGYAYTFEPLITHSIINYCINDHEQENNNTNLSESELLNLFVNNSNNIKISYESDIKYYLLPIQYRNKDNFTVDKTNVLKYTQPCPE